MKKYEEKGETHVMLLLSVFRTDVSGLFRISYSYIGVVGLLTTIGVAIFLSLILGMKPNPLPTEGE